MVVLEGISMDMTLREWCRQYLEAGGITNPSEISITMTMAFISELMNLADDDGLKVVLIARSPE